MNSKNKGSSFERGICKELSLWVTNGKRGDVFWRSAMSGGRATVAQRKGIDVRQCGDICAVSQEGHKFIDSWFIECKHVRNLKLDSYIIKGTGPLQVFWTKAKREAEKYNRDPMIIARQNGWPIIVITKHNHLAHITPPIMTLFGVMDVTFFSTWMSRKYQFQEKKENTNFNFKKRKKVKQRYPLMGESQI